MIQAIREKGKNLPVASRCPDDRKHASGASDVSDVRVPGRGGYLGGLRVSPWHFIRITRNFVEVS
jgi:hypothetical protein